MTYTVVAFSYFVFCDDGVDGRFEYALKKSYFSYDPVEIAFFCIATMTAPPVLCPIKHDVTDFFIFPKHAMP